MIGKYKIKLSTAILRSVVKGEPGGVAPLAASFAPFPSKT